MTLYCNDHGLPTSDATGACTVAYVPNPGRCGNDLADRLIYVLDGWASPDDWGVPSYPYPDTVAELLDCLKAGDNPRALRLMAKQRGFWNPLTPESGWRARTWWKHCPSFLSREYAKRASRRSQA